MKKEQIIYYPVFDNKMELTSHYYRACWYFPKEANHLEKVYLFAEDVNLNERPAYMGTSNTDTSHIHITNRLDQYADELKDSKVILIWKAVSPNELEQLRSGGAIVLDVQTLNPEAVEYGKYCGVIWKYFLTKDEKAKIIENSSNIFKKVAEDIKQSGRKTGCVFGTGPSLECAYEFNFDNCVSVVCNSIVQNRDLLNHIRPKFITAGDVVSHLGVSLYAEVFRKDLVSVLQEYDMYYFTTATFGYLLMEQCSEIKERIILAEQLLDEQNYDLCENFALPKLDSTFNIHMLPIIHSLSDNIYILGCDGKSKERSNEDFWAHAEKAQYRSLVATGHECHPTFDINRQKSTYTRYLHSVQLSVDMGINLYHKHYYTLKKSNIDALEDKMISEDMIREYDKDGRIKVEALVDKK